MAKYQRPPGTHDMYPGATDWADDSNRWNALESTFREICGLYGYGEIRTPIFEATELFTRSVGEGTDIVSKEMYTFTDKGDRSLTLRPEGTAGVVRAYLDSGLYALGGTTKLYYLGPNFRYERPQKGRYRQHSQAGVEALGSDDPALDAEVIQLALAFYSAIGIPNLTVKINSVGSRDSRAVYLARLKEFVEPFLAEFSEEGKARFASNPLRLLDTKNPRELEILRDAPRLIDFVNAEERAHFETLCEYLQDSGVIYEIDPYLVRGFDYYTKTAFEIQSPDLGAQNALGGGGRYDSLVESIGGPASPGIGFGLGLERALIALQAIDAQLPLAPVPTAYIITLGDAARRTGIRILSELRASGIAADTEYSGKSMKAQMRAANRANARFAVILGDNEIEEGTAQVKDLATSEQQPVRIDELIGWLRGAVRQATA